MKEKLRFLGMDVHAETIAAAIAEPDGEVRSLGTIPNRMESIRKLIKKLGPVEKLRVCYEAGPTGYVSRCVRIVRSILVSSYLSGLSNSVPTHLVSV